MGNRRSPLKAYTEPYGGLRGPYGHYEGQEKPNAPPGIMKSSNANVTILRMPKHSLSTKSTVLALRQMLVGSLNQSPVLRRALTTRKRQKIPNHLHSDLHVLLGLVGGAREPGQSLE
jgi:hypothetical protein